MRYLYQSPRLDKQFACVESGLFNLNFKRVDLLDLCKHHVSFLQVKALLVFFLLLIGISGWGQSQTFNASSQFKVPAGVTSLTVECWGAGGAGGGSSSNSVDPSGGGGGAGGAYAIKTFAVTPNDANYTVTVGGTTNGGYLVGATGSPSWFGAIGTVYAQGGEGGAAPNGSTTARANGSSGSSIGDVVYAGGNGSTGTNSGWFTAGRGGAGGGGAGSNGAGGNASGTTAGTGTDNGGGNGGNGRTSGGDGITADISAYGGGGGGSFNDSNQDRRGGNGAAGAVIVSWTQPIFYSTGSGDANNIMNWSTSTGHSPRNFTDDYQTFIIQSGHTMTTSATWTVSGTNTILQIDNGGTLTANNTVDLSGANAFIINGTYNHNNTTTNVWSTTETIGASSTINYGYAGAQNIEVFSYANLGVSGGGTKSLLGNTIVRGSLVLTLGVIQLGTSNLSLTSTASNAIQGTFSATNMIETNGAGYLERPAATVLPISFPIGSNGFYSPVTISAISNTTGTIKVNTEPDATLGSNYLPRVWDVITSSTGKTITATFNYSSGESSITPTNVWVRPSTIWQAPVGTASIGTNAFTIAGTTNITNTSVHWTAGKIAKTYFSYQSGNWHIADTWTTDPGGTTLVGSAVPGNGDVVVILPGRTVTLGADVTEPGIEVNINSGGFLNLATFQFTNTLAALKGQGTLQLASVNFPDATVNTFVNAGGGTTEYNNASNFTLPSAQVIYNNLTINASGVTATQLSDLTLNGNMLVKNGTFRINDNTSTGKRQLTVNGDVNVNSNGAIAVGQRATNTTTTPSGTGGSAPYTGYYENFHQVVFKGNFTNNGVVRFTNLTAPNYALFPPIGSTSTSGAATVYFEGSSNNTLTCNNTTDFYNLVLNKGSDQTYQLIVQSSDYDHFRIFGANTAATTTTVANPDLMKALWIRTGTLVLRGSVVIPSLTEGTVAGSEYYIPANGALVLDGSTVIVLATADDNGEANRAYSVSGTSGINTTGAAYQGLVVYGKLKVNDGYLSTRESAGLLYNNISSGQFEINGGAVDAKQFRLYSGANSGAAYIQTGGTLILRGRFVRPVAYASINDLSSIDSPLSLRAQNGTSKDYGSFNLEYPANIFSMSGGIVRIYDSSGGSGPEDIMDIYSSAANTNVTGGIIELKPSAGTGAGLNDAVRLYMEVSEATLGNLTINRGAGCSTSVELRTSPLTILNDFNVTSGEFIAGSKNVTVGGNFNLATTGLYNSSSTTSFNGNSLQLFAINGTLNNGKAGLLNLVVDKSADTLRIAGSQSSLTIQGTLDITRGALSDSEKTDGAKTIYVAGNITNNGSHSGNGKIALNGSTAQTIGGDGNGVFQNLELVNTNAAAAPVSLLANTTINGALTFSNDKGLNISTYNLKLGANATIVNGGTSANRFIRTSGNVGDGGITKVYSATSNSFTYPIGVAAYTPATVGINGTATTYGAITVVPVDSEHPTTTTKNRSLSYFWRVKSSGFTLGSATVTHGYKYADANIVTGTDITENGYVAARYNSSTFGWTIGNTGDVDETNNIIGEPNSAGNFLEGCSFIDGDYTAGDNTPTSPFGTPTVYYSRANSRWNLNTTWSTDPVNKHTGAAAAGTPTANDIVVIGNNNTVNLTANAFCASLQIEENSVLDIRTYTGSSFGMVQNHSSGLNGKIRVTSPNSTAVRVYTFPNGDFTDFNVNKGTTEFYSTDGRSTAVSILPANVTSYGNLMLTPFAQDNLALPNTNVTIYGDLTCQGTDINSWIAISYYNASLYKTIEKTVYIKGDVFVNGGSLIYTDDYEPQHLVIDGNVTIANNAAAAIDVRYGSWLGGGIITNTMSVGGTITNNNLFRLNNTRYCDLTFHGANSAFIATTAGSPTTNFRNVTVNKGTSQTTTLTCNIGGTLSTPTDNWLTLQNGTFKYERTGNLTISEGSTFTIPGTAGLYINTSSNVLIANAASNTNDFYLNGKLTLASTNIGTTYIGNTGNNNNNDIEYGGDGLSEIDVKGGNLVVNGQIRRNPATSAGVLKYSQSAGNVIINGQSAISTNAKLEVLNYGSAFNMSGGTLNIIRGGGGTVYGDLYIRPETSTVTGGTIVFSNSSLTSAQTYRLDANASLYNLTITGNATTNAQVDLMVSPLVLNGALTLSNSRSILKSNNINVTIKGNFTNNGTAASYLYGTNTTTFSGGVQALKGSSVTNFYNLAVNPVTSLTIGNGNTVTVNNNLELLSGTMICGNNAVHLKNNLTNNATYTETLYGVVLNGNNQQQISGTGTYGRLELDNLNGAVVASDITLNKDLVMTNGVLDIKNYLLSLGQLSVIQGTSFGTSKMIKTTGVLSDNGIRKVIGTGLSSFTYPMGVSGKYTPVVLNVTANTAVGSVRVNNVNSYHPAVTNSSGVLQYYWDVESSGISGFQGSLLFNYINGDVIGVESSYVEAKLLTPGANWSKGTVGFDNVNEDLDQITFNMPTTSSITGNYTAGLDAAIPLSVPSFKSISDGNWNDPAIWHQESGDPMTLTGGPNGFIVEVSNNVTLDANYCHAYQTTITGKLIVVPTYYGHNLGIVSGNGTLYLEGSTFPAGRYTNFFDCSTGGTLEYGGNNSYTILADLYSKLPRLLISGGGVKTMPDKDLTICDRFEINSGSVTVDNSLYNRKLTIEGAMLLTAGNYLCGTGSNATVSFAGTTAQTVENFSGNNALNNLEINNAAGLTLSSAVGVNGNLYLTKGLINTTSTNMLTIENTAVDCVTPAGGGAASYVNGPLTKKLLQGSGYFQYPIGNATTLGNKLSIKSTQTGTLYWTADYVNPNGLSSFTSPLTAINTREYWNVSTPSGGQAIVNVKWDNQSALTPLMTYNGLIDMRVAEHDGSAWTELGSTYLAGSNNYNGSAETTSLVSIPFGGSRNYTLACVKVPKPTVRMEPVGPVCGSEGIPVTLNASYTIFTPYTIEYTIDGGAVQTLSPTSFPATIPTTLPGVYQLTKFTYEYPDGELKTGVVDALSVTVYAEPTASVAGSDQSICGGTSVTLAANNPTVGSGLWSIISGAGGTVVSPTSHQSTFNGVNGNSYLLRWIISNGACTSIDDVAVAFPILASQPGAFTVSSPEVCLGSTNVVYEVPAVLGTTYNWSYSGNGATFAASNSNSTTVSFSSMATAGVLSVIADNGCESTPRVMNVAIKSTSGLWTGSVDSDWTTENNWCSCTLPSFATDVVINSSVNSPVIPASTDVVEIDDLTINTGGSLTLSPGGKLTVNGNVIKDGSLVLQHTTDLLSSFISSGSIAGNTTVEMSYPALTLSPHSWPISKTTPFSASLYGTSGVDVFLYDNNVTTNSWNKITDGLKPIPEVDMKGYLVKFKNAKTMSVSGLLNSNSQYSYASTRNIWDFVGNPYPSFIDLEKIDFTGFGNSVYYILNSGSYAYYQKAIDATPAVGINGATQYVGSMQAFWVQWLTANKPFVVPSTARVHGSGALLKSSSVDYDNVLRLTMKNNTYTDETAIVFSPNGSFDYVESNDCVQQKFAGTATQLANCVQFSSVKSSKNIAIAMNPDVFDDQIVYLGYYAGAQGGLNATITATNIDAFNNGVDVYLRDNVTNLTVNLRNNPSYTFAVSTSSYVNDRFELFFEKSGSSEVVTDVDVNEASEQIVITAIALGSKSIVKVADADFEGDVVIDVYDARGSLLNKVVSSQARTEVAMPDNTQVTVLKVTYKDQVKSFKLMRSVGL